MSRLAPLVALLLGCRATESSPDQALAARKELISSLVMGGPESSAELIEIAAGDRAWPHKLDSASELETRCTAQRLLRYGAEMPQLGIGRVSLRFASRMSWPRTSADIVALLDDHATCEQPHGTKRTFAQATEDFLGWCPVPGLRRLFVERGLEHALQIADYYLSQRVGPTATRIEDAVAKGDAAAFIAALRAIETTSAGDHAEAAREGVAAMNWLRHLVLQDPKYQCCGPLQDAVRDGPLGDALLAHLKIEPDPALRIAIWDVFSMQPKNGSRPVFVELLAKEPDPEVKYRAAASLQAMDLGGEREINKRQDGEGVALPSPAR